MVCNIDTVAVAAARRGQKQTRRRCLHRIANQQQKLRSRSISKRLRRTVSLPPYSLLLAPFTHTHNHTHTRGKCIVQRAPINGQLFELMLTTTTTTTTTTALKLDKQRSDQPKTCNNNNNNNIMHSSIASNYNNAAQLTRNTFRLSPLVTKFN